MSSKKKSAAKKTAKSKTPKAKQMRAARARNTANKKLISLGRRVQKARMAKGLSQRGLAAKLGVTQPCICNIEKAVAGASPELVSKINKALGVK